MINIALHKRVAILIDADNAQLSYIEAILKIAAYYGELELCRAYGDWKHPQLSHWHEKMKAHKIETIQVNRVGKNATDNRLLVEAGEILGRSVLQNEVDVFIIVSGDGDFASLCEFIQDKGRQVIGIGSREITSRDLFSSCTNFYFVDELESQLDELAQHYPIPPDEVRRFFYPLLSAYHKLTNTEDWVSLSQLDNQLRDKVSNYASKYGQYSLSEWLRHFDTHFEMQDMMVRKIDPNSPEFVREQLLLTAYTQNYDSGAVHLSQLGKTLRAINSQYERYFGSKKLSKWLQEYPEIFVIQDDYVIHRADL